MENTLGSTVILAALIVCYILYSKICRRKIRWEIIEGVVVGHIIARLMITGLEKILL